MDKSDVSLSDEYTQEPCLDIMEPAHIMPRWCYTDEEWDNVISSIVCVIDGIEYSLKEVIVETEAEALLDKF